MNRSDLIAICSQLSGLAVLAVSVGLGDQIDAIAPGWGKKTVALLGVVSFGAGVVVRILTNPTPTNTVQVYDRTTGSTVELKTVAPPSGAPAPPPTYSPAANTPP